MGSLSRYGLQWGLAQVWPHWPYGTFVANFLGCFIMGLCLMHLPLLSPHLRLGLMTGFLGSLTTLSSLHGETIQMWHEARYLAGLLHWAGGAVLALLGCGVGVFLGSKF